MSWAVARNHCMNVLQREGFRPEVDSDGDVKFKYEGGTYYVLNNDDDGYFQLVYPSFAQMNGGSELGASLLAAAEANRSTKVAKVWPNTDGSRMNVSAEIFLDDPRNLSAGMLMRCLRCIRLAAEKFRKEYQQLR